MNVEDEIEQILERENSQSAAEIAAQKIIIAEKDRVIADKEQALADKEQKLIDKDLLTVRNLIENTDLSDEQIALIAAVSVSFVQECRADLKKV
jgi:hypothetical protein